MKLGLVFIAATVCPAVLTSCATPEEGSSISPQPRPDPNAVWARIDRLVEILALGAPADKYVLEDLGLEGRKAAHDEDVMVVDKLIVHALRRAETGRASLWVASANIRPKVCPHVSGSETMLRLYRLDGDRLTFLGTTDDTPLVRAARLENRLEDKGHLAWCLTSMVSDLMAHPDCRNDNVWLVRAEYWAVAGG